MRALPLIVLLTACADGSSVLRVTVDSSSKLSGIDHLELDVLAPNGRPAVSPPPIAVSNGAIPPEVDFALRFPKDMRGKAHVTVRAIAANHDVLAEADKDADIAPSHSSSITLTFGESQGSDGGADDLSSQGDMTRSSLPPSQLAFTTQPAGGNFGYPLPATDVTIQDATGQATTSTATVTVALGANPSSAHLTGTLTAAAINGVASFADLRVDGPGAFTLTATASGLGDATSTSFTIAAPGFAQATTGIYGGAVSALAAGATGGARLYAGSLQSGAFVSTNGAQSWTPSSGGLPTRTIKALAVDPTNSLVAFAATDVGIYTTSDGGGSWTLSFADTPAISYSCLSIDPANHLRIYAGGFTHIIVTTNGGTSWSDDSTGLSTNGMGAMPVDEVRSIAISGTTLYAATYHGGFMTQSGAGAWTNLQGPTDPYENCVSFDNSGYLWVGTDGGMWTTAVGQHAWLHLTTGTPYFFAPLNGGCVVPVDATHLLAASRDSAHGGVYSSSNSGMSWDFTEGPDATLSTTALAVDPSMTSNQFAANQHGVYRNGWTASFGGLTAFPILGLAFSPTTGTLFAATDNGGVFGTTNSGMDWQPVNGSGATPLPAFGYKVNALTIGDAQTLYAGSNGLWKSSDGATTWTELTNGVAAKDISSIAIAPTDPMIVYAGYGGGLYKSVNGGTLFTDGNLSSQGRIATLAISPATSSTIYAGTTDTSNTVWKTTNGGGVWNPAGTGLTAATAVRALAIDPSDALTLYAATDAGLYRSSDGATSWTGPAAGSAGKLSSVAVNPLQTNIVIAGGAAGAMRSYDGGVSFTALNGGLQDVMVNAVGFDRKDPATLWAGTVGAGVHKTP